MKGLLPIKPWAVFLLTQDWEVAIALVKIFFLERRKGYDEGGTG